MAKKSVETTPINYKVVSVEEVMGDRFGRYSKYIIQDRALPDVRDGLKPVQRRILYAMFHEGNHFDRAYRKSAKTVGIVIGNYHPHGDSSVYEAMVRLSQSWKVNVPLVDMQGNNGSIDDDPAAAMRYTEARLAKISHDLVADIDEDVVPFVLNFDDTETEPVVLPASYCNLLVNGATGIASGYATNIPPFNFNEVMDATIYRLLYPNSSLEEISEIIKGPDFPTGGVIQGKNGIMDILKNGRGKVIVRSKIEIVETKTVRQIVATEIPYEVIKSQLVKRIDDFRLTQNIEAILDVRDESDRSGLRIVVDVKKEADIQTILNLLYKNTDLQVNYNANMIAIINRRPELCGVIEMLDAYLGHRKDVILRRSRFRIAKMEKRTHILQGLIKAVSILDEVIALIRASSNKADAKTKLIAEFDLSELQAEAILTMQLYRLSSTDIVSMREEFAQLVNQIEYLEQVVQNEDMLKNLVVTELKAIKEKYSIERRSQIESEISDLEIDVKSLITNERVMLSVSRDGYIKRVSLRSYNSSDTSEIALKEGDQPVFVAEVETLDHLVLFTDGGHYMIVDVHDIVEYKWKDVGEHISSMVKMVGGHRIISGLIVKSFETGALIGMVSRSGMVKRTLVHDLEVSRTNKSYPVMNLKGADQLVACFPMTHEDHLILVSDQGYMVNLTPDQVSIQAPRAQGVKGINVKEKDFVAAGCAGQSDQQLVVFTDKGSTKRFKVSDISLKSRPVLGELCAKRVQSNPNHVTGVIGGSLNDILRVYDVKLNEFLLKDVALMSIDQTYSTSLPIGGGYALMQTLQTAQQIPLENEVGSVTENLHFDL